MVGDYGSTIGSGRIRDYTDSADKPIQTKISNLEIDMYDLPVSQGDMLFKGGYVSLFRCSMPTSYEEVAFYGSDEDSNRDANIEPDLSVRRKTG